MLAITFAYTKRRFLHVSPKKENHFQNLLLPDKFKIYKAIYVTILISIGTLLHVIYLSTRDLLRVNHPVR
jgi:hypothetical protein